MEQIKETPQFFRIAEFVRIMNRKCGIIGYISIMSENIVNITDIKDFCLIYYMQLLQICVRRFTGIEKI